MILHLNDKNHRGTYWAPFWGAENNYETLTLEQALFNFEYFLNYVTNQGQSTNQVIEQFNFVDNTPYFPNHAKLAEQDVAKFLQKSVPLLKKYSKGYGLWAYRDYGDNGLYNASFEFGLQGWKSQDATIVGDKNDQQVKIRTGGFIAQSFQASSRLLLAKSYNMLNLCINAQNKGKLAVYVNDKIDLHLQLKQGDFCYKIAADGFKQAQTSFKIVAESDVVLDELKLYGFVQKLDVYDEFNHESKYIEAIRKLNKAL
ncbi:MAG TPA: hypothetical protein ENJ44_03970 [Oceanospirillales bacterium]|nr:hypothetical protein [Oceanospirillales bacterium]